jgi:hypothetical protein
MRVKDATYSIYFGLKRLPWHPAYLAAMWVLGGELRSLYADWIGAQEVPLVETTMDLVREVVIAGESWSAVDRAEELADAWRPVYVRYERSSASGGLLNVLATFEALAQEIARLSGHYDAGNWVTNAAKDRWTTGTGRAPFSSTRTKRPTTPARRRRPSDRSAGSSPLSPPGPSRTGTRCGYAQIFGPL